MEEMWPEHSEMFEKVNLRGTQEWHLQGVQDPGALYLVDERSNLPKELLVGSILISPATI